jgi:uncharacterized protein
MQVPPPKSLDIQTFSASGAVLQGTELLTGFERILPEEEASAQANQVVSWCLKGAVRLNSGVPQHWLHLEVSMPLQRVCQRCLEPIDLIVSFEREFRLVASEALAEKEEGDVDEDLLVLSKHFNVHELIEDELLMSMPIAPMHTKCPYRLNYAPQDTEFDQQQAEMPHPFAVLAQSRPKKAG